MNRKIAISALPILGVVLLGAFLLLDKKSEEVVTPEIIEKKEIATSTEPTPEMETYTKEKSEEIAEKEYGVPVKTEIGTPTKETIADNKWVLQVSFNSLGSDLFLMDGKEETPWMDHVRFDRELTEFEKTEKAHFFERQKTWSETIKDTALSEKVIKLIKTTYIPEWESKIAFLENSKIATNDTLKLLEERYGKGSKNIPEKYLPLYHSAKDLNILATDLVALIQINIRIKEKTIEGIAVKNVDATVMAANDEDRNTLVVGWHEERLEYLLEKNKEIVRELESSVAQSSSGWVRVREKGKISSEKLNEYLALWKSSPSPLLGSPLYQQSNNYGKIGILEHITLDVEPWIQWGNSPGDTSTPEQRVESLANTPEGRAALDYFGWEKH